MSEQRHYSRAPITEALIHIGVVASETLALHDLQALATILEPDYPRRQDISVNQFEIGPNTEGTTTSTLVGYSLTSHSGKYVVQARLDGFTLSRLAPYESWTPFRDEARRIWQIYRDATEPRLVTRLAVRYINRLDIPLFEEMKHYVVNAPDIPDGIPDAGVSGYFMQLQVPQPDLEAMLVINHALPALTVIGDESGGQALAPLTLDFDLFRDVSLGPSHDELWDHLESLHERKNVAFEASITDKTRGLIQ